MSTDTISRTIYLMTKSPIACSDSTNVEDQSIQKSTLTFAKNNEQKHLSQKRAFCYMNNNDDSNSAMSHDDDDQSIDSGKKIGLKQMVEEYDEYELEEHQIKRKAQNRAAQRAFRERKELYVKELENKIKRVQDSHHHATTQLYHENQQLRFIIYKLELEITNLKGTSIDNHSGNESCLLSVDPPPDLNALLPSPPTRFASLIPLQIRPSSIESCTLKIIPNVPDKKKKKIHHSSNSEADSCDTVTSEPESKQTKKAITKTSSSSATKSSVPINNTSGQRFTFSVTTPATLRASSNNESARKNEKIETVQLYPDHSHPANYLLEKSHNNAATKTDITPALSPTNHSSNDSVTSGSSDEDDKIITTDNNVEEFNDIFLDTSGDFDFYDLLAMI